jgi:hypothetical protein
MNKTSFGLERFNLSFFKQISLLMKSDGIRSFGKYKTEISLDLNFLGYLSYVFD